MKGQELSDLAAEIARYVIEDGQLEGEDEEWWLTSLGAAVLFEADVRGLENATEIADKAVRLYRDGKPGSPGTGEPLDCPPKHGRESEMNDQDVQWMRRAIALARSAREKGNHPFGAVLVDEQGHLLMEAENTVLTDNDPAAHPEAKLAREAAKAYNGDFLAKCTMYASTEPCPMCASVMARSRVRRVRYGVSQERFYELLAHGEDEGSSQPSPEVLTESRKAIQVEGPILEEEALQVHAGFWA